MSAYLDQQITAREKLFLEQHLAACADCRVRLETTRSMITALRAMPVVKAPRSFVLPREMARQPRRSTFAWYPALRFATVIAALALAILFSSDLLLSRSGASAPSLASIPAAAPAPEVMMSQAQAMPTAEAAISAAEAPAELPVAASLATSLTPTVEPPLAGGAAAKSAANDATPLSAPTATPIAAEAAAAPEATAIAAAETAQPPVADHALPAARAAESAAPAPGIDPWRVAEMALLGVVIALGAATLIARQRG